MEQKNIDIQKLYDVIVIGGGPSGLTAAIYLARAGYRVVVLEKDHFGGQITITSEVVNYPGVPKCSGTELTDGMRRQAESFGAEFMLAQALSLNMDDTIKTVETTRGRLYSYGILLATGAHPRSIGFEGETEYKGRGVAYCATCDGEFFTGKDVFVVGGGFAAAEESVFLTRFARHVTILIREEDFTCAAATADPARNHPKIAVLTNKTVEAVSGENGLNYIRYKDIKTGEVTEYRAESGESFGVFVFAGYEPATELADGLADLNEQGYILTDRTQQTSLPGLYAAGDVCVKPLRQVVTAVGDGALAATELEKYCAARHRETGLIPKRPEVKRPEAGRSGAKPQTGERVAAAYGMKNVKPNGTDDIFDEQILTQLETVFARMEESLILRLYLDNSEVSAELRRYMEALAGLTDKLTVEIADETIDNMPCVKIFRSDGTWSGLAFHGVPGGHEFTSFVLGLYNAAGEGQSVDERARQMIGEIAVSINLKAFVSLSCTMCPELVTAAQKIASMNEHVTAEVYDLNHFPALRDKYQVMSVPCLVVNDEKVFFGKKNIPQLLGLIKDGF